MQFLSAIVLAIVATVASADHHVANATEVAIICGVTCATGAPRATHLKERNEACPLAGSTMKHPEPKKEEAAPEAEAEAEGADPEAEGDDPEAEGADPEAESEDWDSGDNATEHKYKSCKEDSSMYGCLNCYDDKGVALNDGVKIEVTIPCVGGGLWDSDKTCTRL